MRYKIMMAILMACAGLVNAAVVAPHQSYDTGTWIGSINTLTQTGKIDPGVPEVKYWEYEGVAMDNYYDTVIPYAAGSSGWFTQKYTAAQSFSRMTLRYSYGVIQSGGAGSYVDISTDNTNWTRVWTIPGGWPVYFPTTLQTFTFAPTTTLYVRHGAGGGGPSTTVYTVIWRIFPAWDPEGAKGGVMLYESANPTTCDEALVKGYSITGDFNNDCRVNFADFANIAAKWLYCNVPGGVGCATPWLQ